MLMTATVPFIRHCVDAPFSLHLSRRSRAAINKFSWSGRNGEEATPSPFTVKAWAGRYFLTGAAVAQRVGYGLAISAPRLRVTVKYTNP
ncbi:hypothetical protein PGTUg99_004746 [Puccinia graminis f. sp. tritici]|uniref:Uncharacterized protein n=1 Tax=Puccinia graminis f. sp. tritici TaxID=56615 RepID=A0A5B0PSX5_PUCGR|nr:hypothetical protein PGTUg99_004746 [Puccinia graminis f. sp. tritici]